MEIRFCQKSSDAEIFLKKDSSKFFNYTYLTEIKLFERISKQSIQWFIRHINKVKKSSTKEECESFCQKIIKLIYLRKDLCESKSFNFPLFFSPSGECLTGDGRILISTFYVPEITFDCIFHDKKSIGNYKVLENLVLEVFNHKKYFIDDKIVLCFVDCQEINFDIRVNYVRNLELISNDIYEQKLFDCTQGYYLSRFNLNYDLWDEVYEIIKSHHIENINDYVSLLDKITSVPI